MGNEILLKSYTSSREIGWGKAMKTSFEHIGLLDVFLNVSQERKAPHYLIFLREKDIFQQSALANIQSMSKLENYTKLKNNITIEKYLIIVKNVFQRTALTKFRLSNHALMREDISL